MNYLAAKALEMAKKVNVDSFVMICHREYRGAHDRFPPEVITEITVFNHDVKVIACVSGRTELEAMSRLALELPSTRSGDASELFPAPAGEATD